MAAAKPWVFQQLAPPGKTLTLDGWNAPFGRPRQGTIINAGLEIRKSATYYPGPGNIRPTIHAYGVKRKDFELHGRWMDAANSASGAARKLQRDWDDFISDQVEVRAKWGDILSYLVFLHEADFAFESEAHVVWKMTGTTILDEQAPVVTIPTPPKTPIDMATELAGLLSASKPMAPRSFFSLRGLLTDVQDRIDAIVGAMNQPFADIYETASAIGDFETALASDLVKIGSACQTLTTAAINLRDMTDVALSRLDYFAQETIDLPVGIVSGADMTAASSDKIESDAQIANMLVLLADIQSEVAAAQRGQALAAHAARDGDTWESIATQQYGDPSGARAIRDANAIRYGERPQPGKVYHVPRNG